ncbi:MAG: hypothetical protein N3A61_10200, partial [Ignavibacteria bacterium]|nr:hypothetical protein [Ignavibacteria bacterium]
YQLRLFKKSTTTLTNRLIHEGFKVDGKVGYLKNKMIHLTHIDLKDTFYKINEYTSLSALEKVSKTKVSAFGLLLRPVWDFLHHFIFRKGFKDGVYGLMVSLIHSMTKLQTYLKIWELRNVSNKRNFVSSNSTNNKHGK